ncbi:MAG TPA: hypothetical protein VG435_09745 [Acidimicrobiales bacterium]|jgi:WAS/WASL-interacting protein|nr:hypothetical protein [Acidimicrobiales bacterium]
MDPDSHDEMQRRFPDYEADERLLSGRIRTPDSTESLRGVAHLFEAAKGPATDDELVSMSVLVPAMAAEVLSSPAPLPSPVPRRRAMLSKILTAKVAAAAAVAVFGIGTAAAAATGTLPTQTSHASGHAAAGLATAAAHRAHAASSRATTSSVTAGSPTSSTLPATGPANRHAQFGLCTAFLAVGRPSSTGADTSTSSTPQSPPPYNSTAFRALIAQNGGVAGTTTYCQGVVANHSTTSTTEPGDTVRPDHSGKPAKTGKPEDTGKPSGTGTSRGEPPVSIPANSGTGPADTTSRGNSASGAATEVAVSHGAGSAEAGQATHHP